MTLNTESDNPASRHIDKLSTDEIVGLINAEDAKVATAVQAIALPQVAQSVEAIVQALSAGGRLFLHRRRHQRTAGRILDAVECVPTFSAPSAAWSRASSPAAIRR